MAKVLGGGIDHLSWRARENDHLLGRGKRSALVFLVTVLISALLVWFHSLICK